MSIIFSNIMANSEVSLKTYMTVLYSLPLSKVKGITTSQIGPKYS